MLRLGRDEKHLNGSVGPEYCTCLCSLEQQRIVIQPGGWSESYKDLKNFLKGIQSFSLCCLLTQKPESLPKHAQNKSEHLDCEP